MCEECVSILQNSRVGQGLSEEQCRLLLESKFVQAVQYRKGEVVFHETDRPRDLLLLHKGKILVAKDTMSGRRIILTTIDQPGELFGEVYAFMNLPQYDMYAEAVADSLVLKIHTDLLEQTDNGELLAVVERIQRNLLSVFAQKAYHMNQRMRVLGSTTLREKIARYLMNRQKPGSMVVHVQPREEMADYLNVTRPSLSRELMNMADEGILSVDRREITILDQDALEEVL